MISAHQLINWAKINFEFRVYCFPLLLISEAQEELKEAKLRYERVTFLGYIIRPDREIMDQDKVSAVKRGWNQKTSKNIKEFLSSI